MATKQVRVLVSVVIVGAALSLLLFTTMSSAASYYKHVDEVMSSPEPWYGKNVNLHGFVVNTIYKRPNSLDYRFSVKYGDKVVLASYTGVVPDNLKEGTEVVLAGRLAADGFHVNPNGVTTKCPSRYDPDKPQPGEGK